MPRGYVRWDSSTWAWAGSTAPTSRRPLRTLRLGHKQKPLSPVIGVRGFSVGTFLIVQVSFGRCRLVEFARWANGALAGIGPRKPGRHVPVQMVDGVRVFGVGLVQFAGEDLRLLPKPSRPPVLDLTAVL